MWSIANAVYGDGERWVELATANLGQVMNDGRLFVDPSLIYPGWQLRLPGEQAPAPLLAPPASSRPLAELQPRSRPSTAVGSSASPAKGPLLAVSTALLSLGGGALLLGLLRRRRRRLGRRGTGGDPRLVDAEIALCQVELLPTTALLERAVLLAAADGALDATSLLELGEDGARLFVAGRERWRASPADLQAAISCDRAPSAVIPLGGSPESTWSLLIPSGQVGRVGGAGAEDLVTAALSLQEELAWGYLVVGSMEDLVDEGTLIVERGAAAGPGRAVVEVCEPDRADAVVGDGALELVALKLRLPAASPSEEVLKLLELGPEESAFGPDGDVTDGDLDGEGGEHDHEAPCSPTIVVRLLTTSPRIEGLAQPLEPRRERRAVELVAYLALHQPEPVTGDRLRSRVLGTRRGRRRRQDALQRGERRSAWARFGPAGEALLPAASPTAASIGCLRRSARISATSTATSPLPRAATTTSSPSATSEQASSSSSQSRSRQRPRRLGVVRGRRSPGPTRGGGRARSRAACRSLCSPAGLACPGTALPASRQRSPSPTPRPWPPRPWRSRPPAATPTGCDGLRRLRAAGRGDRSRQLAAPGAEQRYRALRLELGEAQASLAAMEARPTSTRPSAPAAL